MSNQNQTTGVARLPQGSRRDGFSMVEVIIAIVILAVGVLGLAGTTGYIVRQITLGDLMTERAAALQTTIDRLSAIDYDSVDSGSDSVGSFAVSWSAVRETGRSKMVTIITVGPGLSSSGSNPYPTMTADVADTFEYRVMSR